MKLNDIINSSSLKLFIRAQVAAKFSCILICSFPIASLLHKCTKNGLCVLASMLLLPFKLRPSSSKACQHQTQIFAPVVIFKIDKTSKCLAMSSLPAAAAAAAKSLQSCPTLCDAIDGSPGSPVPGILQARTLEWVAISFSNA